MSLCTPENSAIQMLSIIIIITERVPRRRFICTGIVQDRMLQKSKYLIKYNRPDDKEVCQQLSVTDITNTTVQKELKKKRAAKKVNHLQEAHAVKILLDPTENPGSCQFASAAHQLSLYGIYRTLESLRQDAVAHIQTFSEAYKSFVVGTFEQYLIDMQTSTTYGDHITLLAIARNFNKLIQRAST